MAKKSHKRDKERDEPREPRKRRSRSRSPRTRDGKKSRHRSRSPVEPPSSILSSSIRSRTRESPQRDDGPSSSSRREETTSSKSADSMSIEETNKVRAKLGLKPLDLGDGSSANGEEKSYADRGEVFIKTTNISDQKEREKIKERIAISREKREIAEALLSSRIETEQDSDEEDISSWVEKSRRLAIEKEKAVQEEEERMMREEEERKSRQKKQMEQDGYGAEELKGITVSHNVESIMEGSSLILTLKDSDIIDELKAEKNDQLDQLENVNLKEDEKAKDNILKKKKGKDYNPYEEQETLLSKYDEVIDGNKVESFKIGGTSAEDVKKKLQELKESKGLISFSLEEVPGKKMFASEYYTEEEMATFKKPKKKGKKTNIRTREVIKPIVKVDEEEEELRRSRHRHRSTEDTMEQSIEPSTSRSSKSESKSEKKKKIVIDKASILLDEDDDGDAMYADLSNVVLEDDEAGLELQLALERSRQQKTNIPKLEDLVSRVKAEPMDEDPAPSGSGTNNLITLDATQEFVRNLGARREDSSDSDDDLGLPSAQMQDEEDVTLEGQIIMQRKKAKEEEKKKTWREVLEDEKSAKKKRKEVMELIKSTPILEEEPDASKGVAAALKLAMNKGYLDKEVNKSGSLPAKSSIAALNYQIEEKFYESDKRQRFNGSVQEFKDKVGYNPDVKLEYVDDNGRMLSAKEAFRQLSHKFHGKGSGKNKIDKREKKLEQESKLRQMSSTDTPLNTVQKLQEKQKELQSPFVIISGQGTSLIKKGS